MKVTKSSDLLQVIFVLVKSHEISIKLNAKNVKILEYLILLLKLLSYSLYFEFEGKQFLDLLLQNIVDSFFSIKFVLKYL
jgi:hypothetical protein